MWLKLEPITHQAQGAATLWSVQFKKMKYTIVSAPQKDRDPLFIMRTKEEGEYQHQVCQIRMDVLGESKATLQHFIKLGERMLGVALGDLGGD